MAILINYLDDGLGIEIIASGVVRGEDIIEAHKEIYNEKNLKSQKYQIIDRSDCKEYIVSNDEVRRIAEIDKEAVKSNPNIIIAIVASTDFQFGISRMWQAYVDDSFFLTNVFRDRKRAEEWIKNQLNNT